MRPTAKMMNARALRAPAPKAEEPSAPAEDPVRAAASRQIEETDTLRKALVDPRNAEELAGLFQRGQELLRELAAVRHKQALTGREAAHPVDPRAAIDAAFQEASAGLATAQQELAADVARRTRLLEAKERGLERYLAARARGLGQPPKEPKRG